MTKQSEELACLYVLDQLDSDERASFEQRLLREPGLAELVRDLEPSLEHAVNDLPRHDPPAGTLDRIEVRIAALRDITAENSTAPRRGWNPFRMKGSPAATAAPDWFSLARWGVAAVIAVSLATLAIQGLRPTAAQPVFVFVGLDANRSTFAELPAQMAATDPDERFIQLAVLAENFWKKPAELPARTGYSAGDSRAYALFDPGSRQGFIAVEQLPAATEGQRYHLWIVDPASGRVRAAGSLPLDGMSRGLYSFALGSDDSLESNRPNFFITLEEAVGEAGQPQGKVVLGGRRI